MNSHYETLYGVGLLDDLHNYFPAILYEPQTFHSVPALLRYIHTQTRNRFDLFSLGQREYRSSHPVTTTPATTIPATPPSSVSYQVPSVDLSGNQPQPNSTLSPAVHQTLDRLFLSEGLGRLLGPSPLGPRTSFQYTVNLPEENEEEEEAQLNSHLLPLLTTLLRLPPPRANPGGLDAFLQPVVVRPTADQISANTTVGHVSEPEHTCAVCQDTLTAEQEGRKLNACGHWFHQNCIDTWLEGNVHCPVCRHDIREPATQ